MKKGHRRTNSQTIGLARPFNPNLQKPPHKQHNPFEFSYHQQKAVNQFASIESLLQKSSTNIAQRVLYIENLQQPNTLEDCKGEFSFGKGLNYRLSSFKLNMGEIPQVPKSNESTSLQGENKLEIMQKETFFTNETYKVNTPTHSRISNQLTKPIKFQPKHMKTSSAVGMKKISKFEKSQKPEPKHEIKSVAEIHLKDNPLKRPKLEYQIQKKITNPGRQLTEANPIKERAQKQSYLDSLLGNEHKKKKKQFIF